ncbi:MAG: DUF268 domain-containing protein [Candidatus Lokiarchaeota archaeon]|nr:DUF268 domain-containing protein [Candidatus Lokiarchaeota archaeon]
MRIKLKERVMPIYRWMLALGFDFLKTFRAIRGLGKYFTDFYKIQKQSKNKNINIKISLNYPCLLDHSQQSGKARGHYFHQDLLVAQKIFQRSPKKHVDIASRIDGFVAHVASFRQIEVFDIRPIEQEIPNVKFQQIDFMKDLGQLSNYCDSLSCLHALEHFGLGRYGDTVDIDGYLPAIDNFHKLLQKDGILYLSVPIGSPKIEFNAHRIFSIKEMLRAVNGKFNLLSFSFINDKGRLNKHVRIDSERIGNNCDCNCGCGIFELEKQGGRFG